MKLVTVVVARPLFVKAAAVSHAIAEHNRVATDAHPSISEIIIHTGLHFDANMSEIFFEEMPIPRPDYNLEINSMGHGAMTGRMLDKIEGVNQLVGADRGRILEAFAYAEEMSGFDGAS